MANIGLPPSDAFSDQAGLFMTFIVAAAGVGCNLKCPPCFIARRRETSLDALSSENLKRFIEQAAADSRVRGLAIQGYEPLLAESEPHTRAILETAHALALPVSIVTNGTMLTKRAASDRASPQ